MKSLKILISALAVIAAASAMAQGKPGTPGPKGMQGGKPGMQGGMRRGMMNPELTKQLALTAAQKKKMEAAQKSMRDQMMKLKPEERRTKGREIFMKMRKDMDAIFTPKQKAILEKWRKDHPMRGFGGPGGRPGGPGAPAGMPGGAKGGSGRPGGKSGGH